jgi:glycosyltransferase involved in cell wall biosynthesis
VKVALVHDYLREYGGAERVVEALHEIFPEAPVHVAYKNLNGLGSHKDRVKKWNIKSSWIQYLPFANPLLSYLKIIAPTVFENMDLSDYDLVISSCNTYFSKAVKVGKNTLHISYIHTPPRYLYGFTTTISYKNPLLKSLAEIGHHYLRVKDYEVSQRPDVLVANSKIVQERIKKFYRRDSQVIYPPINIDKFKEARTVGEGGYFLSVSRLVKGKGVELVVKACSELNLPLKVVGGGPQLEALKKIAGRTVEFLGPVSDSHLPGIYASAGALILAAADEDFGITPVEAMASGTPVLALRSGGYLETVVPGKTGEFFDEPTAESLKEALKKLDYSKYKYDDLVKQAEKFSEENFKKQIIKLIDENYKKGDNK